MIERERERERTIFGVEVRFGRCADGNSFICGMRTLDLKTGMH